MREDSWAVQGQSPSIWTKSIPPTNTSKFFMAFAFFPYREGSWFFPSSLLMSLIFAGTNRVVCVFFFFLSVTALQSSHGTPWPSTRSRTLWGQQPLLGSRRLYPWGFKHHRVHSPRADLHPISIYSLKQQPFVCPVHHCGQVMLWPLKFTGNIFFLSTIQIRSLNHSCLSPMLYTNIASFVPIIDPQNNLNAEQLSLSQV